VLACAGAVTVSFSSGEVQYRIAFASAALSSLMSPTGYQTM
jgi:hypothetical protein